MLQRNKQAPNLLKILIQISYRSWSSKSPGSHQAGRRGTTCSALLGMVVLDKSISANLISDDFPIQRKTTSQQKLWIEPPEFYANFFIYHQNLTGTDANQIIVSEKNKLGETNTNVFIPIQRLLYIAYLRDRTKSL